MGQEILETFESRIQQHPFVLKSIRIFQSLEELLASQPLTRPKVIFATSQYLDGGDARELFFRMAAEPKNLMWLLGVAPENTLARRLLEDFVLNQCARGWSDQLVRQAAQAAFDSAEARSTGSNSF